MKVSCLALAAVGWSGAAADYVEKAYHDSRAEVSMSDQIRVAPEVLQRFTCDLFIAAGLPDEWALAEAEVLVWADMRGLSSHGVLRIPSYMAWMERGLRNPDADIRVVHRPRRDLRCWKLTGRPGSTRCAWQWTKRSVVLERTASVGSMSDRPPTPVRSASTFAKQPGPA